ncbi:3-oxoacid CoA-transferase subunit B [Desulfoluna spongiiphila]|uniref:3-oxoacid CoA-transferase subunit B n=1 Tax=Desulfoluna spongiiphila TaxID=419481 RepID=UPI001253F5CB|nr:3-oxoacid CoA-transferase subunit B [Desulfoluna spongiiphila]VVS91798.1 3-oxoacid coa-transferase subunit b [Desulfoluna spongiiphila]
MADKPTGRELIARRIAREFKDGDIVNLGIGMPTLVANFIPEGVGVLLQSENGFIGIGPAPAEGEADPDLINAGNQPVTILPGGCFFDSATSFGIIRGGHIDATVLGTLEVDQEGNIANYIIPGKMVPGMGGAMDLCTGAKKVIIATDHTNRKGESKILMRCNLPLTAVREANLIVTELAVMEVIEGGLLLKETAPGVSVEEVLAKTEAVLMVPDTVGSMI